MMGMYLRCTTLVVVLLMAVQGGQSTHPHVHWTRLSGALQQVSVGVSGVWGVNSAHNIFYRTGTYMNLGSQGIHWQHIHGALKQVDVGTNIVWGVSPIEEIFYRAGISKCRPAGAHWIRVSGALKHVSVSDKGHVWGVNRHNYIYRRVGASICNPAGKKWERIPGALKQISVGPSGVWGVNHHNKIFYRTGTYGDTGLKGTGWQQVTHNGRLRYVTSGLGRVIGTNRWNYIFIRAGVNAKTPTGTSWRRLPGKLHMIEGYDNAVYWGVTRSHAIYRS